MNKEKDLEYYKKLNYDVILRKRGSNFVLLIPELCCVEEEESLEKAYEKLNIEKEKYFKKMIKSDSLENIKEPEKVKIKKTFYSNLLPFVTKLTISVALILLISVFASYVAFNTVNKIVYKRMSETSKKILTKAPEVASRQIYNGLISLQKQLNDMPDEKKEEIRLQLRKIINEISPFVDEFKVLSQDTTKTNMKIN